ncbi:4Fe-4S dicluster domain-containing protein [Maridesulfovibrio hydrothermalis]|uniref:4Fe-4S ferredoxin iron-sulfur binding domain protein n=1 Tax=Maridesulfovibrio hydrothermalis AM13 = DSM 14728 TaxID=1121451 RepID=L0R5X2_9BACT|nr:4Fe-4S binding protein [Maridesulfovibrio hydrothermalis]CCO22069.1 4Fe-4S ferredoxin iron-sulfur binding domain protein [Maridesulfovibrio hydrothermalis AM13 = DSM 14728]
MSVKRKGNSTVTIFPDWCKGCGICAAFCPGKVMELNDQGKAVVVREEECISCGFCELHCPDFAIMVRPKVDAASAVHRAVLEKADLKTGKPDATGKAAEINSSGKEKG